MPGMNHKGPNGEGAMTGRRMGRCANFGANAANSAGDLSVGNAGKGSGRRMGRGNGGCHGAGRRGQNSFGGGE